MSLNYAKLLTLVITTLAILFIDGYISSVGFVLVGSLVLFLIAFLLTFKGWEIGHRDGWPFDVLAIGSFLLGLRVLPAEFAGFSFGQFFSYDWTIIFLGKVLTMSILAIAVLALLGRVKKKEK